MSLLANVLIGTASFVASNWVPSASVSEGHASPLAVAILIIAISGLALQLLGPNAIFFGTFLGSGWALLNRISESLV